MADRIGSLAESEADRRLFAGLGDFWDLAAATLEQVFHEPEARSRVDQYRRVVEGETPPGERLLVYHDSPLQIAADLAGVEEVGEEQARRFLVLQDAARSRPRNPRDAA